jgi:hypothetical protein
MKRFTMTHEFNCSPDSYWKLNFDKEMNEAMFRTGLKFPKYDITESREDDREIFRRTVATPTINAPAVVQKALGSSFQYTEESRFNKTTKVCTFKGIPSVMADKLITEGTMRVEALAGGARCRRVIEVMVEAKIFGVGGIFESTTEENVRMSYDKSASFVNQWIADKKIT